MTRAAELSELEQRLRRIESALLDTQARLPGLAAEIRAIRQRMTLTADNHEPAADRDHIRRNRPGEIDRDVGLRSNAS